MTTLEPPHLNGSLGEVEIVPTKIASLAHPQAVPVNEQPNQPIAVAVPIAAQRIKQPSDLIFGQMLADAVGRVGFSPDWSHNSASHQLEVRLSSNLFFLTAD